MLRQAAGRVAGGIPTLFGVMVVVFLVIHLIPGDPVSAMLGDRATAAQIASTRHNLGLDKPLWGQFVDFLGRYVTGNFGDSIATRQSVLDAILDRLPYTIELAAAGVLISVLLGVPLGVLAATHRGKAADHGSLVFSMFGVAAPSFWVGLLLAMLFAVRLGWFPTIGAGDTSDPASVLRALVLPALALGLSGMALIARMTRSSMLEVLGEDYVRTARAKGVPERFVVYKHALRNAAIPILTVIGLNFGHLLGGTIVMETVFARPGLGKLLLDSILARDYPMIQGVTFVIAVAFIVVNIVVDLMYAVLDPRIKRA
jgi:ABC-type dipeptide/oligopeptide/nickel transport system permease component